jgi:DeoR/GlpR family transcriptional regulator of sugar metabolism
MYLDGKQTVEELSQAYGRSSSTIRRQLSAMVMKWEQPMLHGSGYVNVDATY